MSIPIKRKYLCVNSGDFTPNLVVGEIYTGNRHPKYEGRIAIDGHKGFSYYPYRFKELSFLDSNTIVI